MHNILNLKDIFRVLRFLRRKLTLSYWENKFKYKSLYLHDSAELNILGKFNYQKNVSIGKHSIIIIPSDSLLSLGNNCYIGRYCEIAPNRTITIGQDTSIQDRTIILGDVSIGKYCVMAPNVYISSGRHYYKENPYLFIQDQDKLIHNNNEKCKLHSKKVTIEDDCWIGINVVIMSGVTIGKGSVIGANSVVTKDIEPYTVSAGVPAKTIDYRLQFFKDMPLALYGNEERSFPYFYSGIDYSVKMVLQHKYAIIDAQKFTFYMDNTQKYKYIHIELESEHSNTLRYKNQTSTLPDGMQDFMFDISSDVTNFFEFTMHDNAYLTKIRKVFFVK